MVESRQQDVLTAMYGLALNPKEGASHRIQAARVFLSYEAPLAGDLEVADNLFAALQASAEQISTQTAIAQAVLMVMDLEPDREYFHASEVAETANVQVEGNHSAQIEMGKTLSSLGMVRERVWIAEDHCKRWVFGIPGERDSFRETLLDFTIRLGG